MSKHTFNINGKSFEFSDEQALVYREMFRLINSTFDKRRVAALDLLSVYITTGRLDRVDYLRKEMSKVAEHTELTRSIIRTLKGED